MAVKWGPGYGWIDTDSATVYVPNIGWVNGLYYVWTNGDLKPGYEFNPGQQTLIKRYGDLIRLPFSDRDYSGQDGLTKIVAPPIQEAQNNNNGGGNNGGGGQPAQGPAPQVSGGGGGGQPSPTTQGPTPSGKRTSPDPYITDPIPGPSPWAHVPPQRNSPYPDSPMPGPDPYAYIPKRNSPTPYPGDAQPGPDPYAQARQAPAPQRNYPTPPDDTRIDPNAGNSPMPGPIQDPIVQPADAGFNIASMMDVDLNAINRVQLPPDSVRNARSLQSFMALANRMGVR